MELVLHTFADEDRGTFSHRLVLAVDIDYTVPSDQVIDLVFGVRVLGIGSPDGQAIKPHAQIMGADEFMVGLATVSLLVDDLGNLKK